jgi:hypothetical protein
MLLGKRSTRTTTGPEANSASIVASKILRFNRCGAMKIDLEISRSDIRKELN